jgi:tetratricopeptide (TPR) repeat protein
LAEFVEQRGRDFVGREEIAKESLALARSPAYEKLEPAQIPQQLMRVPDPDPTAALSFAVNLDAAGVVESTPIRSLNPSDLSPTFKSWEQSPSAAPVAWGVCITGEPGLGKSSVFADLSRALRQDATSPSNVPTRRGLWGHLFGLKSDPSRPDKIVLAHAAGISARSTSVESMLRRWIGELATFLAVRDPIPAKASTEEVESTFASLLGRAATRTRVVVLIDALNQFEPTIRGRFLTWLPRDWPANARLIATTVPGDQADALRSRHGVRLQELAPLSVDEAEAVARAVCKRYHRTLHPDVLLSLVSKRLPDGTPAAGNPLWLTLAVDQLNLLDEDEFARADRAFTGTPEQRLHKLVLDVAGRMPPDVASLYGWLLAQAEKVHGAPSARAFADVIALSRFGWRESDLRALVPSVARLLFPARPLADWDNLKLAAVRRAFRSHVAKRGQAQRWDFFHVQMREAIHGRDLDDARLAQRIHAAIAEHLGKLPASDPLRQSEYMVHLIRADDRARAAREYGELPYTYAGKAGATQALAAHLLDAGTADPNSRLDWVISLLDETKDAPDLAGTLCTRFTIDLSDALANEATVETRRALGSATRKLLVHLAAAAPNNAERQQDLSVCNVNIGDALLSQGELNAALDAFRASLNINKRLAAAHPRNVYSQREISGSHDRIGDVLIAQGDLKAALAAFRASLDIRRRLAAADPGNATWQRELAVSHTKIGDIFFNQGDLNAALDSFRASLEICQRLAAVDSGNTTWQHDLAVNHIKLGYVRSAQGDLKAALGAFRASLDIIQRLASADPVNASCQRDLSVSHNKVGEVLSTQGDLNAALAAFRASLDIRRRLAAADPGNATWQKDLSETHRQIGDVFSEQGDLKAALSAFRASLEISQRLAGADPGNATGQKDVAACHIKIGDVVIEQGELNVALDAFRASLEICQQLSVAEPGNVFWQRDLSISHDRIGDALIAQGDSKAALAAFRAGLDIRQRLADADPGNATWQRNLAVSHTKIGEVVSKQGDLRAALPNFRAGLEISQRLAGADPGNATWQRDLAVKHIKIGEIVFAQGDLKDALSSFRTSLDIIQRLAAVDSSNATWRRDLAVCHIKIGDVASEQGDLNAALAAFRASLDIRQRLAAADPANATWQFDVGIIHERIGSALRALGSLSDALAAFRRKHDIIERLAAADPANATWQHNLAVSHTHIGDVFFNQGDMNAALDAFRASLEICQRLAAADPGNAAWQRDLWVSCYEIANVLGKQGNRDANDWLRRAHDVLSGMVHRGLFVSPKDLRVLESFRSKIQ